MDFDDDALATAAPTARPSRAYEARFIDTAATADDELRVRIPALDDGRHSYGPVRWAPNGATLPQAGELAAVMEVITERGGRAWWVVSWIPS